MCSLLVLLAVSLCLHAAACKIRRKSSPAEVKRSPRLAFREPLENFASPALRGRAYALPQRRGLCIRRQAKPAVSFSLPGLALRESTTADPSPRAF